MRRNRLDLMSAVELTIFNAIQEVEKMGADVRLTNAVILLSKAKDCVADFIDNINPEQSQQLQSQQQESDKELLRKCWHASGMKTISFSGYDMDYENGCFEEWYNKQNLQVEQREDKINL